MSNTKAIESGVADIVANDFLAHDDLRDYELVRVKLTSGGRFLTLQVMAERKDRLAMTVNDCVKISHAISPQLDQSDPVAGRYTLEVTSPGLDRPLIDVKDFQRYAGHVARIELSAPLQDRPGQKRFQGSIVRVTGKAPDAEIEIKTEAGGVRVPANTIAKAQLVLTDAPPDAKTDTKH